MRINRNVAINEWKTLGTRVNNDAKAGVNKTNKSATIRHDNSMKYSIVLRYIVLLCNKIFVTCSRF